MVVGRDSATVAPGFVEQLLTRGGDEPIETATGRLLHESDPGSPSTLLSLLEPAPDQARRGDASDEPNPAHHEGDQHRRSFQVVSMTISVAARLTMSPMACSRLVANGTV